MTWRTHIDQKHLAPFGVAEAHTVFFRPHADQGGTRRSVVIMIPETPPGLIKKALRHATKHQARVAFIADTRAQAEAIAAHAARLLPKHRRISYELAAAGQWGAVQ
jgi:hypothetical protein